MKVVTGILISVIFVLGGCATSGRPPFTEHVSPEEKATIYIYRPRTVIGIANTAYPLLVINDVEITGLAIGGYVALTLDPGSYRMQIMTTKYGFGALDHEATAQEFQVNAGETKYAKFELGIGDVYNYGATAVSTGSYHIEMVNKSEAMKKLSKTKLLPIRNRYVPPKK